jgi:hypothetical protein
MPLLTDWYDEQVKKEKDELDELRREVQGLLRILGAAAYQAGGKLVIPAMVMTVLPDTFIQRDLNNDIIITARGR